MRKQIEKIYEEFYNHHHFSGAGLVKRGDDVIYAKAYGYAHRGFKLLNAVDTMFDTASVTKLFTAVAALQLVDAGIVRLEDRITEVIDLKATKIPADVSIAHLLTHTSGIADDADEEAGEKYEDLFVSKPNYSIRCCSDFIPQFAYKESLFKAGTDVRYNNCAFVLLGLAIEKLTGESYQNYVEKQIFNKCGMTSTMFCAKDDSDSAVAEGYYLAAKDIKNTPIWRKNIYSYPPIGTSDGGAYTNVRDLDIFVRVLKAGKLLSQKMTKEILKPQIGMERSCSKGRIVNGFGFHFLYGHDERLIRMYKEGQNAGVAAMVAYYPDIDTTNIVLANQTCNVWKLHERVEEILLKDANA